MSRVYLSAYWYVAYVFVFACGRRMRVCSAAAAKRLDARLVSLLYLLARCFIYWRIGLFSYLYLLLFACRG
jgi:hypothetical protein